MGVAAEVEAILKRDYGVRWFRVKVNDQLRLLRLKQWEEKYRVPMEWILAQLIPFWREKYSKYQRSQGGFGVTVATLVGSVSEEVLRGKIKHMFPDGENLQRWRAREQLRQWTVVWDRRETRFSEDPVRAVREYRDVIQRERRGRKKWMKILAKRPYRGNPWVSA